MSLYNILTVNNPVEFYDISVKNVKAHDLSIDKGSSQLQFGTGTVCTLDVGTVTTRTVSLINQPRSTELIQSGVAGFQSNIQQTSNNTQVVTSSQYGGVIVMFGVLAASAQATFVVVNDRYHANSQLCLSTSGSQSVSGTSFIPVLVDIIAQSEGQYTLRVTNPDTLHATLGAPRINFSIW